MKQDRPLKIAVVGGGTAGHVFPVLAVIQSLRAITSREHKLLELLYIGRRASQEEDLAQQAGIPYMGISAGKLRRYADIQNFVDPFRVMLGFFEAIGILLRFRPDVVFAKGGYVSVPVIWAAALLRIPVVAHESDAIIGLSNRLAARFATTMCLSYPLAEYKGQSIGRSPVFTGNPVRTEFLGMKRSIRTRAPYTVVVMGGSQGARAINQALKALIEQPLSGVSVIHVTGPANYGEFADLASTNYHPQAYAEHVADLMAQADVVISRAGGSVFELAATATPAILIPLSVGSRGEQRANAQFFAEHNAAIVIEEADLSARRIREAVASLLKNAEKRRALSAAIRVLAAPNAAEAVANEILKAAA